MAKKKPKNIVYEIEDLEPDEYSELVSLFTTSGNIYRGKPSFKLAVKLLTLEDVCSIYQVSEDYLEEQGLIKKNNQ